MKRAARTAALIGLLSACQAGPEPSPSETTVRPTALEPSTPNEVTLADHKVRLETREGRCVLVSDAAQVELQPAPPCGFVFRAGALQHHAYEDVGVLDAAIVVGAPVPDAERTRRRAPEGTFCGLHTQAVFVTAEGLQASKDSLRDMMVCPSVGVDEKVVWQLTHPD